MKFTLTYRGPLLSGSNYSRSGLKQEIRRNFHNQLKPFWVNSVELSQYYRVGFNKPSLVFPDQKSSDRGMWCICNRGQFRFVPLVINGPRLQLICHLDILLLRYDEPGEIFTGGDLDGRIKVLFDALSVPQQVDGAPTGEDEDPMFVLLEDDKLITGLSIRTEKLWRPKEPRETDKFVELTIGVTVEAGEKSPLVEPFGRH